MQPLLETSREHRIRINDEISHGSNPRPAFFLMVALSSLIAAFGLVMNSTAVVIGAMLVAPLMTPILGISLALVRGDSHLLGVALRAEAAGVAVALLGAMLLGLAIPFFESTPEMLSRTQPNLFDLMVAILAGSAGAYALVDEKLSPALPGVAISTAIVPPLANAGLSASLGAYQGAWGSFLLFSMNFLSILLASAVVFAVSGLGGTVRGLTGVAFARRFGLAVIGLVVVSVLMVGELSDLIDVKGRGYMIGVRCADPKQAAKVTKNAFTEGLIIERCGPEDEIVKCMMPLTTTMEEMNEGLDILESVCEGLFNRNAWDKNVHDISDGASMRGCWDVAAQLLIEQSEPDSESA